MKIKEISSSWLNRGERRLDGKTYVSKGFAARLTIAKNTLPKRSLSAVTLGGDKGIFIAPYFKRVYVEDAKHGTPMLGNTDILMLNPKLTAPLLSKKVIKQYPSQLKLESGWTLVTCFGTVGDMVYVRKDMEDCVGSTNFMRIIPDPKLIKPGYLYAYLACKYGHALITQSETGSIIPNLLPSQVLETPILEPDKKVQERAHDLILEASEDRTNAGILLASSSQNLQELLELPSPSSDEASVSFSVFNTASSLLRRLDAAHFSPICNFAQERLSESKYPPKRIGEVSKVFTPGIFKRIHVEDPKYGYAYFSGSELFRINPEPRGYLSKKAPKIKDYIVKRNWLLIQDAGQLGGLIGRPIRVNAVVDDGVVSNHLMRICPDSDVDAGYLFALLSSWYG